MQDHTFGLFFKGRELGEHLEYGPLKMVPVIGTDCQEGTFASPSSSISMTTESEYGRMRCVNRAFRPTIFPLHMGFFRQDMQSHIACSSHILEAGEELEFTDACLVRDPLSNKQKGLKTAHFFLPFQLRNSALNLRGIQGYTKLWGPISRLNKSYGLDQAALLDAMKNKYEQEVLKIAEKLKAVSGQTGAIFYLNDQLIGVELTPDESYWKEIHQSLIAYCYGPLALIPNIDRKNNEDLPPAQAQIDTQKLFDIPFSAIPEEGYGYNSLLLVECDAFIGQAVMHGMQVAYLSLFHRDAFQIR